MFSRKFPCAFSLHHIFIIIHFFSATEIPVLFKATSMCMHHKFCLIDTRDQTEKEKVNAKKRLDSLNKRKMKKSRSIAQKSDDEMSEKEINETKSERKTPVYIPQNGICITGSCNWTMQGFSANWENVIITNNKLIVAKFRKEFDRIWDDFIKSQPKPVKVLH